MNERLNTLTSPPSVKTDPPWWFIFAGHRMMVFEEGTEMSVPLIVEPSSLEISALSERYMGTLAGRPCYCAVIAEDHTPPPKTAFYGLRYLYGRLEEPFYAVAMKAVHLVLWESTARYCGRCGKEMAVGEEMNARQCTGCGMLVFPRLSPAVIVLVEKDGQLLLARSKRFTANFFSVLAGFVEPGETLEDTVHREIEEEVGIKIRNVRYFGSQPWPFPDSLMIGFTAEYAGGEIRIDESELAEAGWFSPDNLPTIPGKISIARQLIDWFLDNRRPQEGPPGPRTGRQYDPRE